MRPTGTPWNAAANEQALRTLQAFDHAWARRYFAHPRVKNDTELTDADFAKYNVVLFGDPGSNKWIGRLLPKLPLRWTKDRITVGTHTFQANQHMPALVYPGPLNQSRYVVLNSGLTFPEAQYNSDYSLPMLGDIAVLTVGTGEIAYATLFDEGWQLPND